MTSFNDMTEFDDTTKFDDLSRFVDMIPFVEVLNALHWVRVELVVLFELCHGPVPSES
jgi:hypothetical protein